MQQVGALEKVDGVALKQSGVGESATVTAWHRRYRCIALGLPFLCRLYQGKHSCLCSEKNISFFLYSFQVNSPTKKTLPTFQQTTKERTQTKSWHHCLKHWCMIYIPCVQRGYLVGTKGHHIYNFWYWWREKGREQGNSVVTGKKLTLERNYCSI